MISRQRQSLLTYKSENATMTVAARTRLPRRSSERLEFIRGLVANPRKVASLFPSSRPLARRIAAQVDLGTKGLVLELGPGTGAITTALVERGIEPSRLLLVEANPRFANFLRARFPDARTFCRNALEFEQVLQGQPLAAIVSGLPLLNFDDCTRTAFVDRCLSALGPQSSLVQLSFGWTPPVRANASRTVKYAGTELMNFPPATVWVYARGQVSCAAQPVSNPRACKVCGAPSVESGEEHNDAREPLCLHHLEALDPPAAELPKEIALRTRCES